MAKAIIMSGGSGGVTSDDVTVVRDDIPEGKMALTRDSNDEVVPGTMKDHFMSIESPLSYMQGSDYYIGVPKGAYRRNIGDPSGICGGTVYVSLDKLRENIGATNPKNWRKNVMIAGQAGEMPEMKAFTIKPGQGTKTQNVAGYYMAGNITVVGINIPKSVIKKDYRLVLPDQSVLIGEFEGYVPKVTTLYGGSVNSDGFSLPGGCEEGFSPAAVYGIMWTGNTVGLRIESSKFYDLGQYKEIFLQVAKDPAISSAVTCSCEVHHYTGPNKLEYLILQDINLNQAQTTEFSIPLGNLTTKAKLCVKGSKGMVLYGWSLR